jgi:two-component system, NtrC family, sensor kinase
MIHTIMVITDHQLEMSDVAYEVNLPDPHFTTRGDHMQIQQCLMNLIFNAMEAMPEGGKLIIAGGHNDENQTVWLKVTDTGIGIEKEDLPRIFEPFYTTKKIGKGVGLGLSMVHGIISEHKGSIEVDSKPGKGSVFKLTLPVGIDSSDPKQGEKHDAVDANTSGR